MATAYANLLNVGTKIIAVGRNYAARAKELGNVVPKDPVLFMKPTSSYLQNGGTIESSRCSPSSSLWITRLSSPSSSHRELAMFQKLPPWIMLGSAGLPWTIAKGQDTFTPISSVLPKASIHDPDDIELWLKVDDEIRQKGSTKDMIFKIPYLISHISSLMTLLEGDVILTERETRNKKRETEIKKRETGNKIVTKQCPGTPSGVGPVKAGQKVTAGITNIIDVHFNVENRRKP